MTKKKIVSQERVENHSTPEWCSTKSVHDLLRQRVLKGNVRLPKQTDDAVERLAQALSVYSYIFKYQKGDWEIERVGVLKVKEAISAILEFLPKMREEYLFCATAEGREDTLSKT